MAGCAGYVQRYRLRWRGRLVEDAVARVAAGMTLPDDPLPCLSARLECGEHDADGGVATLELCEGRNHQVKRMLRALGGEVTALHRDRLGQFDLPADLAPGEMRPARSDERARLGC